MLSLKNLCLDLLARVAVPKYPRIPSELLIDMRQYEVTLTCNTVVTRRRNEIAAVKYHETAGWTSDLHLINLCKKHECYNFMLAEEYAKNRGIYNVGHLPNPLTLWYIASDEGFDDWFAPLVQRLRSSNLTERKLLLF
jgi:hypothetical protein